MSFGMLARGIEKEKIKMTAVDMRNFSKTPTDRIDDRVYGGGAGMLFASEPLRDAIEYIGNEIHPKMNIWESSDRKKYKTLLASMSPGGTVFKQMFAKQCVDEYEYIILIAGRYEGIDARIEQLTDMKISTGDYIVSGGELPAMIVADAITRLIPGVLGNEQSMCDESSEEYAEYPQYTRPESIRINNTEYAVPDVLLSGNHAEIESWKRENRFKRD